MHNTPKAEAQLYTNAQLAQEASGWNLPFATSMQQVEAIIPWEWSHLQDVGKVLSVLAQDVKGLHLPRRRDSQDSVVCQLWHPHDSHNFIKGNQESCKALHVSHDE